MAATWLKASNGASPPLLISSLADLRASLVGDLAKIYLAWSVPETSLEYVWLLSWELNY